MQIDPTLVDMTGSCKFNGRNSRDKRLGDGWCVKVLCWPQMNTLTHMHVHNDDRQALMHERLQRSATLGIH